MEHLYPEHGDVEFSEDRRVSDQVVDLLLAAGQTHERIFQVAVRHLATFHLQPRIFEDAHCPSNVVAGQPTAVRPVRGERVDRRIHEVDADLLQQPEVVRPFKPIGSDARSYSQHFFSNPREMAQPAQIDLPDSIRYPRWGAEVRTHDLCNSQQAGNTPLS